MSELLTCMPALSYSMNPKSRKRFRKKLTRERVVPIISASVSWLIFAMTGSGLDSRPKLASKSFAGFLLEAEAELTPCADYIPTGQRLLPN